MDSEDWRQQTERDGNSGNDSVQLCKPEVTGSIPVRSIGESLICRGLLGSAVPVPTTTASAVRADLPLLAGVVERRDGMSLNRATSGRKRRHETSAFRPAWWRRFAFSAALRREPKDGRCRRRRFGRLLRRLLKI